MTTSPLYWHYHELSPLFGKPYLSKDVTLVESALSAEGSLFMYSQYTTTRVDNTYEHNNTHLSPGIDAGG